MDEIVMCIKVGDAYVAHMYRPNAPEDMQYTMVTSPTHPDVMRFSSVADLDAMVRKLYLPDTYTAHPIPKYSIEDVVAEFFDIFRKKKTEE